MAENYKRLYEQMKKTVEQYQDEIVPGLREQLREAQDTIEDLLHDLDSMTRSGSPIEASFLRMKWELDGRAKDATD